MAAGIHGALGYKRSESSMEGISKDQKLAATITPPVKPSIPSRTPRCIDLKKNTKGRIPKIMFAIDEGEKNRRRIEELSKQ